MMKTCCFFLHQYHQDLKKKHVLGGGTAGPDCPGPAVMFAADYVRSFH